MNRLNKGKVCYIGDEWGLTEKAVYLRKRRLRSGLGSFYFQGIQKRRFFTEHVTSNTCMKVHLHAKTASQNTVSQVTGFCGFLNGFSDTFGRCLISPSKKYIPLGGLDGKGGNEHSR